MMTFSNLWKLEPHKKDSENKHRLVNALYPKHIMKVELYQPIKRRSQPKVMPGIEEVLDEDNENGGEDALTNLNSPK